MAELQDCTNPKTAYFVPKLLKKLAKLKNTLKQTKTVQINKNKIGLPPNKSKSFGLTFSWIYSSGFPCLQPKDFYLKFAKVLLLEASYIRITMFLSLLHNSNLPLNILIMALLVTSKGLSKSIL